MHVGTPSRLQSREGVVLGRHKHKNTTAPNKEDAAQKLRPV